MGGYVPNTEKERQEMLQNLQRDMNNLSRSSIADKLKKAGLIIGKGVAEQTQESTYLPNLPY